MPTRPSKRVFPLWLGRAAWGASKIRDAGAPAPGLPTLSGATWAVPVSSPHCDSDAGGREEDAEEDAEEPLGEAP